MEELRKRSSAIREELNGNILNGRTNQEYKSTLFEQITLTLTKPFNMDCQICQVLLVDST